MKGKEVSKIEEKLKIEKEILKLKEKFLKICHKIKMKELEYIRESDRLHHERELERGRIKSAEIRKSQLRKLNNMGAFKV